MIYEANVEKPTICWKNGKPYVFLCGNPLLDRKAMAWCIAWSDQPGLVAAYRD